MNVFNNITNKENGTAVLLLYGNVGEYERVSSERVVAELRELSAKHDNIEVHINSRGGDVFTGLAIYTALKNCDSDITIVVDGIAASIAAIIALCGKPLVMNRFSRLMLHRVSGGAYGTAEELRATAELCESIEDDLAQVISAAANMKAEDVKAQYFDGKDHWLTAEECLKLGLCREVRKADAAAPATDNTDDVYNYYINNQLRLSGKKENDMDILNELKKRPVFAGVTDEASLISAIVKLENSAAKATSLEDTVKKLKEKLEKSEEAAIDAYLKAACDDFRINEGQLPYFKNLMKTDKENTMKIIDSLPKKMKVKDYIEQNEDDPMLKMSWDELDKNEKLAEFKSKYPERFEKMYKQKYGID